MKEKLWKLLKKIPRGKVTTYGTLAELLGTSPRAVGKMLNSNPNAPEVPCHRVVMSDGSIGGYSRGVRKKVKLLKKEGVDVRNLKKYFHKPKYR
jgi:methylated-DNA-[protein]-cysteine S-methyltransferase